MTDPIARLCQIIAEMLRDAPEISQAELVKKVERAIAPTFSLLTHSALRHYLVMSKSSRHDIK